MKEKRLRAILRMFHGNAISEGEIVSALKRLPFEDMGFAKVDHHRALRCGSPEVIFCPGKTPAQVVRIATALVKSGANVLATRAGRDVVRAMKKRFPKAVHNELARTVSVLTSPIEPLPGKVVVVAAGTSDLPVAEEARVTAETMGADVRAIYDVGVAGLHRLLSHHGQLMDATVIIVVAGMEGALASVVGGLVSAPVIGVPTSVGYGASFQGLAPLLTMLNSCAAGVTVVNIDNGFGAGYTAALICRTAMKKAK
jgi:pyridinium-3,5-biscarboxylic acid mononucleotide synthase